MQHFDCNHLNLRSFYKGFKCMDCGEIILTKVKGCCSNCNEIYYPAPIGNRCLECNLLLDNEESNYEQEAL
jgi:hypothetical protein